VIIVAAVLVAILETEPSIARGRERTFAWVEYGLGLFFFVEYLGRFWAAAEMKRLGGGWTARWRWARSLHAIIDMLAFAPILLVGFAPAYVLRLIRIARLLQLAQLGGFSKAWAVLTRAISGRRFELMLTGLAAVFVLIVSATLMYFAEGEVQPQKFGSIPRSLWWSIITLTTIGYGDVYPVTALGKVLTGITAVFGVGLIAAPTGIIAAAIASETQRLRISENEARMLAER